MIQAQSLLTVLVLGSAALASGGCGIFDIGASTPSGSAQATLPTVQVSCAGATQCADNSANGHTLYVYWNASTDNCTSTSSTTIHASGSGTVSCTGGTCTGSVTTWAVPLFGATTTIAEGTYKLCAYISSSSLISTGAPVGELANVSAAGTMSTQTISSWSNL